VVDANGNATDYVFDTSGNVLSKTQHLDAQTPVTWSYTYNSFGEVLTAQDPLGVVTKNEYDSKGNLTCTSPDSAATTCSNAAIKTKFAYNTLGQLTQITDPRDTTGAPMKTNIAYYASGSGAGMISTITDAQSKVTTYAYDARNNRTSVADPVNGSSNPTRVGGSREAGAERRPSRMNS
jgi:YD repeat-containing protein